MLLTSATFNTEKVHHQEENSSDLRKRYSRSHRGASRRRLRDIDVSSLSMRVRF